ncbi:hypothetical protein C2G38_2128084 [Gigaspora rosea]|uniref:Uncharacterized protein n=1 Tax=Gigaspora rosea TaxID=44941 RepID=A0A397TV09_9GLOM|nr:hypothetical protein C2G38_2128084 [Gigaspora rosea]
MRWYLFSSSLVSTISVSSLLSSCRPFRCFVIFMLVLLDLVVEFTCRAATCVWMLVPGLKGKLNDSHCQEVASYYQIFGCE